MESIRLFKAWLSLLTCLLISLNMWAQDSDKLPDIPILENVSIITKRKKRDKDAEILDYLNNVAEKLNEIIVSYNRDGEQE